MQAIAATVAGSVGEAQTKPIAGLVYAVRFHGDGTRSSMSMGRSPTARAGFGCISIWLTRARHFLYAATPLPQPARAVLVSADEHQQLHESNVCIYGVLADLVCGLSGATEEIGFLHFALTESVFISSRRHQLNAIEATRKELRRGLKVQTPAVLLEVIIGQMTESLDRFADGLANQLDHAEERTLADELNTDRKLVGTVRVHRQLVTLRLLMHRFEHDIEAFANPALSQPTHKLGEALDWLDTEIVELRDRSRLLQEEIMLKSSEQTNRSLHLLSIVTTVFLPATLVAGIFGVNVGGLPLTSNSSGFLWVMALTIGSSALVYWLLKRSGLLGR